MVFAQRKALKTHRRASSVSQRTAVLSEEDDANSPADHGGRREDRARREDVVDKAREERGQMTLTSFMIADDTNDADEVDGMD